MVNYRNVFLDSLSPSVWREWIEIRNPPSSSAGSFVSLRVEGVD